MPDTFPLIKWDAVDSAIQSAQSLNELNQLRSKIETLHILSKQSRQSLTTQNKIASYRLRVDRKRGEWLEEHIENGGDRRSRSQSLRMTLKDVGVTKQESHVLQQIAKIPDELFRNHIVSTLKDGQELTTASVLRLQLALKFKNRRTPPLPKGSFSVIYADPPYQDESGHTNTKPVSEFYLTMTLAEICRMGKAVQKLTAPNCVLFLWIPAYHLEKFPKILDAWGFRYCTCWVWHKVKPNFSHYGEISHELIVIGGKGRSVPSCSPKALQSVSSVQAINGAKHNGKPMEYYEIIERLYPNGKYLELFSREKKPRKGWTVWGDKTEAPLAS